MTIELISKQCLAEREQLIGKYCDTLPADHAMPIEQIREAYRTDRKRVQGFPLRIMGASEGGR